MDVKEEQMQLSVGSSTWTHKELWFILYKNWPDLLATNMSVSSCASMGMTTLWFVRRVGESTQQFLQWFLHRQFALIGVREMFHQFLQCFFHPKMFAAFSCFGYGYLSHITMNMEFRQNNRKEPLLIHPKMIDTLINFLFPMHQSPLFDEILSWVTL